MVFSVRQNQLQSLLCVYYAEVTNPPTAHPDNHEQLNNGAFLVQIGKHNPFRRSWLEEETVNKDTQTSGGTKGFSLKPAAASHCIHRSTCQKQIREISNMRPAGLSHHDLERPRI